MKKRKKQRSRVLSQTDEAHSTHAAHCGEVSGVHIIFCKSSQTSEMVSSKPAALKSENIEQDKTDDSKNSRSCITTDFSAFSGSGLKGAEQLGGVEQLLSPHSCAD